jgi:mutual gliding-motility protein MglA
MVLFNYATKELTAKVVYYGPGLCGKTTNLQWIHEKLPIKNKGKMLSLATETDRTLFFDFLPIELGTIRGMKTRIQLYTVPGQVFYNATRRMVLKGADCVVFVADSQEAVLEANLESFGNLRENLEANEIDPNEIPMVLQYNKRDLPNALPLEILNERMNERNHPFFEAVALKGIGVEDTLKGATALVFRSLAGKYGEGSPAPGAAKAAAMAAGASTIPPAPVVTSPVARPAPAPAPTPAPAPRPAPAPVAPAVHSPAAAVEALAGDEELEPLELEAETEPEPMPPPRPAPAARTPNPRETLVRTDADAADLRRRLRPQTPEPSPLELTLEEHNDGGPVDELTLEPELEEVEPTPPPASEREWPSTPKAPVPVWKREEPAPVPPPAAPEPRAPQPVAIQPISIEISAGGSGNPIAIPVELRLDEGSAQAVIELRLVLNLKLK